MTNDSDSQGLWKRYVSRRAALRAGILGAAIPGILYVAKSADSADAADGDIYIPGAPNFLELGYGWPGKDANAGKISYRKWSDGLDIVGAGTTSGHRKVKIWDDLYVPGLLNLRAYPADPAVAPTWTAFLYAKSVNGQTTKPFWKDATGTAQPLVSRSATLVVAASDASPRSKLGADYVCDGTADEVEIKAAIAALPATGGKVVLSEGTFHCDAGASVAIALSDDDVVLEGQGMDVTILTFADKDGPAWGSADLGMSGARTMVKDLTVIGCGASASVPEFAVTLEGPDCTALRVRATNCSNVTAGDMHSANFYIESTWHSGARQKLIDCESDTSLIDDGNRGGVMITNPKNVLIHGLYSHNNAKNGIVIYSDVSDSIKIIDYHSESDGNSGIKFIPLANRERLADRIEIVNPHIEKAGFMGIDGSAIQSDCDLGCLVIQGGTIERCVCNGIDLGAYAGGYTCIGVTSRMNNYKNTDTNNEGFGWGGTLKRVTLIGCRAISNGSAGIGLWRCQDALIEGCLIVNNGLWQQGKGVFVFDSGGTAATHNTVRSCRFADWGATAAKNLSANANSGQKVVKVALADGAVFFAGQKVSIDANGGAAELNVIDAVTESGPDALLTMVNNLARNYTTANSANVTGVATQLTAIEEAVGDLSDYNVYEGNNLRASAITWKISRTGTNSKARNNIGYVTDNSGTATLANGATSVTVSHGLDVTPSAGSIMVTPIGDWGSMTKFWAGNYTSTQFTIYADRNPGMNVDFAWKALVQ
jgi:hypothetical protein